MGDFNWITPHFVAFASPQHRPVDAIPENTAEFRALPHSIAEVENSNLPDPFKNVLAHFKERSVGLVVRLNSELYSPSYFTALGIEHIDMIFDDGTCPPLQLVKKFIRLAHEVITKQKRKIAVHCKAGLGRTGCLIGAYLIYRWGFTANDLIAFMRFMRPGMVVGPQQHWLHINQGTFRQWWWEDQFKEKLAQAMPATPTRSTRSHPTSTKDTSTPPQHGHSRKRAALGEIDHNEESPRAPASNIDDCLPAPTPGQPRKTSRMGSPVRAFHRTQSASAGLAETKEEQPENAVVEVRSHRRSQGPHAGESEEEWQLHRLSRRTSSRSPTGNRASTDKAASPKPRAVSYTTTTTTTYNYADDAGADGVQSDVENWGHEVRIDEDAAGSKVPASKRTPGSTGKSGSGSGTIAATKVRSSPTAREVKSGVRKTSGRMGSMGSLAVARAK
jgi:cell division cycle 14